MSYYSLNYRLLLLLVTTLSAIQVFGQKITLPQSLLELRHSPAPYECAVLSAHVYQLLSGAPKDSL